MRRLIVVLTLLLMMIALNTLKVGGESFGNPLTLASIGFVLLAAFSIAESLGGLAPRVTGYILAGVLLGPQVMNLLSARTVSDLRMFNTLALGLIALSAGMELSLKTLRSIYRTLLATVFFKVVFLVLLVGAGTFFYLTVRPLDILHGGKQTLAFALLITSLAMGTSAAVVVAVIREARARGRVAELTFGGVALSDVVLVLMVSVAIAIAQGTRGGGMDWSALPHLVDALLHSVLAGLGLGGVMLLYLRYVRAEMLLFVSAVILAVAEVAQGLHLELPLVFMVAGAVVRNLAKDPHALERPLEKVALPVFVVFFSTAAAGLDFKGAAAFLPLTLLVVGARSVAYFLAGNLGGWIGGETPAVRKTLWLVYLPKAGIDLGMVAYAAHALPEWAGVIQNLGLSVVAANMLAGPFTLRAALAWNGEMAESSERERPSEGSLRTLSTVPVGDRSVEAAAPADLLGRLTSPKLRELVEGLRTQLSKALETNVQGLHRPALEMYFDAVKVFLKSWSDPRAQFEAALRLVNKAFGPTVGGAESLAALQGVYQRALSELPAEVWVELEARHRFGQTEDRLSIRVKKVWSRLVRVVLRRQDPQRQVLVRVAARLVLEEPLIHFVRSAHNSWYHVHCAVLEELRQAVARKEGAEEVLGRVSGIVSNWQEDVSRELDRVFVGSAGRLVALLENVGSVSLPGWKLRLSEVEPKVRKAIRELQEDKAEWPEKLDAVKSTFRVSLLADYVENEAIRIISHKYFHPVETTTAAIREELIAVRRQLVEFQEELGRLEKPTQKELEKLGESVSAWSDNHFRGRQRFRKTHINHYLLNREIAQMFNTVLPKDVEHFWIVSPETPPHKASRPRDIQVHRVHLRGAFEHSLVSEVLPLVEEELEQLSTLLNGADVELREGVEVVTYAWEAETAVAESGSEVQTRDHILEGFERAVQKLSRYDEDLTNRVANSKQELGTIFHQALDSFRRSLAKASTVESARSWVRTWVTEAGERVRGWERRLITSWRRARGWVRRSREEWVGEGGFDAAKVREHLERLGVQAIDPELPAVYRKLFSLDPLRDRRFFTVNRDALERVRLCEREWAGGEPITGVLVHGTSGSGRTSLLNVWQLELGADQVVRLDDSLVGRQRGLLGALAEELGCRCDLSTLRGRLLRTQSCVLVDNWDHWVRGDQASLGEAREFLQLVTSTMGKVFWVATVKSYNLDWLERVFALREVFSHRASLEPLSSEAIQAMIETRHRVSGMSLDFERNWGPAWLGKAGVFNPRSVFFRMLTESSSGNLRQALLYFLQSLERNPLDATRLRPVLRDWPRGELPFLGQLPKGTVAMLSELLRYGPWDRGTVMERMRTEPKEFRTHERFLQMCQLLEVGEHEGLSLSPSVVFPLVRGLQQAGVL